MRLARTLSRSILGALLSSSVALANGPFGINAGDRVWENPNCRTTAGSTYRYRCSPPPTVDPVFDSYRTVMVVAPPNIGACLVTVFGPVLTPKHYGEPGSKPMDDAALYLRGRYGESFKKYDVSPTDPKMSKPEMWWSSILAGERDYRYVWNQESGYVPVDRVNLVAMQYDFTNEGPYILVAYRFDNFEACQQAVKATGGHSP